MSNPQADSTRLLEPEPLNQLSSLNLEDTTDGPKDTPVWLRGGKSLDSNSRSSSSYSSSSSSSDTLNKEFLRKYIHYAKNRVHPEMSVEAMETIATAYADMRSKQSNRNLPVTARSLETLIRISSAHAKSRLCNTVEVQDVEGAKDLVNFVLFHEVSTPAPATSVETAAGEADSGRKGGGGPKRGLDSSMEAAEESRDTAAASSSSSSSGKKQKGGSGKALSIDQVMDTINYATNNLGRWSSSCWNFLYCRANKQIYLTKYCYLCYF